MPAISARLPRPDRVSAPLLGLLLLLLAAFGLPVNALNLSGASVELIYSNLGSYGSVTVGNGAEFDEASDGSITYDVDPANNTVKLHVSNNFVWGDATATLRFSGGSVTDFTSVAVTSNTTGQTYSASVSGKDLVITLPVNSGAGDVVFTLSDTPLDTVQPTVTGLTASSGRYGIGQTVQVSVSFSEAVYVTGTPQLTLETGATDRVASYLSGNGTSTLVFSYTVQAGDTAADLDYVATNSLALNGGTIRDAASNNAILVLPSRGAANSLGANANIIVDGVVPTVSSVTSPTSNGTYKTGDTISVVVNFSETVIVTGTPQLTLETGLTDRSASYSSGSGTSALTFTYTVQSGDTTADLDYVATNSLALNGGSIRDEAGNNATLTLASPGAANSLGANRNIVIDAISPTVTSVTSTTANDTYKIGDVISISVNFSETVTVTGTPQLTLETGATDRVVNYASGSGTGTLVFSYTVQAGDQSADLDYASTAALALNGGTIRDAAGNAATLALASPGSANSLGANRNIVIDGVRPAVTSIAPAGSTFGGASSVTFTVTFSETVTGVTPDDFALTVTGTAAGTIVSVSHSGTTSDVTVGSISGDGTLRLDLRGSTDIADAAGNTASGFTSGTVYTRDGTAPAAPVVVTPANGSISTTATPTVTGTAEVSATVSIVIDGVAVGTTSANGAGSWSYAIGTALSAGTHTVRATATDAAGNTSPDSPTNTFTVDATAPSVTSVSVPANGTYGTGTVLSFTVNFDENVTIDTGGGTPYIALTIGSSTVRANYISGSGSSAIVFTYTVQAGDSDPDGITVGALSANGGTLRDPAGNDAVRTLNSVASTTGVLVDTTAPTVTSVSVPANGTYVAGQVLDFTVTFSENIIVDTSGGTPVLLLTIGATGRQAAYISGSGSSSLVFRYTVVSGDSDGDGVAVGGAIALTGGTMRDAGGLDATTTLNGVGPTAAVLVDAVAPTVTLTAPAGVQTGPFTVTATFSKPVSNFVVTDVTVTGGTVSAFAGGGALYSFDVTPSGGGTVTILVAAGVAVDGAGNQNAASAPLAVSSGSPESEFAAKEDTVRDIIQRAAVDTMRSRIRSTERMIDGAIDRLLSDGDSGGRPFSGNLQASGGTLSTTGTFARVTETGNGARRLVLGDFSLDRSGTGTVTASLDARLAWEVARSDRSLYGAYIGMGLGVSDVAGGFDGPIGSASLNAGVYGLARISDGIFLDGFFGASAGRNELDLADSSLALSGTYRTLGLEAGTRLSGRLPMGKWEFRPAFSLSAGRTLIGDIDFAAAAFGQAGTVTLDAGGVTLVTAAFSPEILIPLDDLPAATSSARLTMRPLLLCETVRAVGSVSTCGGGLGIGLAFHSGDGRSTLTADIDVRDIGTTDRSLRLDYRHSF